MDRATNFCRARISGYALNTGIMGESKFIFKQLKGKNMKKLSCLFLTLFLLPSFALGSGSDAYDQSSKRHTDAVRSDITSTDASLVGFKRKETGAIARTLEAKAYEEITPEDFGAKADGETDDTIAMQKAINAWSKNRSIEIRLVGRYLINGTLSVGNLEADDPETRLNFTGGGTLIKNNAGFMFDKATGQVPQTGHINFIGVRFEGANLPGQTFILNGNNVIRVHFESCFGTKINIAKATNYLQTIYLQNTTWRKWSGYLLDTGRLYDVSLMGSVFEAGDAVLITRTAAADPAANSLKVIGSNIEGMNGKSGAALSVGVTWGSIISGNYFEGNAGGDLNFNNGTGYHKGLVIEANGFQPTRAQIATGNYYPVVTGKGAADSIVLLGNSSTNHLFDITTGNQSAVLDAGNYVATGGEKFSATSPRRFSFSGTRFVASLLPGHGVNLHSYHSAVGFEPTRTMVGGESVVAEILYGSINPQSSPGSYSQTNWKKGSVVFNNAPSVVTRSYGGTNHSALLIGWICITDGAPGTWQEISTMLPD